MEVTEKEKLLEDYANMEMTIGEIEYAEDHSR